MRPLERIHPFQGSPIIRWRRRHSWQRALSLIALALVCAAVLLPAAPAAFAAPQATETFNLVPQWNAIEWDDATIPVEDAIEQSGGPTHGAATDILVIWGYDATTGVWLADFPADGNVSGADDLTEFVHLQHYFVYANVAFAWSVTEASGTNDVGVTNTGLGNTGSSNVGTGNIGTGNIGNGNTGSINTGTGNVGTGNIGNGNTGSVNTGAFNDGTGAAGRS